MLWREKREETIKNQEKFPKKRRGGGFLVWGGGEGIFVGGGFFAIWVCFRCSWLGRPKTERGGQHDRWPETSRKGKKPELKAKVAGDMKGKKKNAKQRGKFERKSHGGARP